MRWLQLRFDFDLTAVRQCLSVVTTALVTGRQPVLLYIRAPLQGCE